MTLDKRTTLTTLLLMMALAGTACGRPSLHPRSLSSADQTAVIATSQERESIAKSSADEPLPGDGAIDDQEDEEDLRFLWHVGTENGKQWTAATMKAIAEHGQGLWSSEPSDITAFCPKYKSLDTDDRTTFWVQLISAIAFEESAFKAKKVYKEKFKDSHGKNVRSRGLLQISQESGNLYGCGLEKATDLEDAETNLACGVRILNRWVLKDDRITGRSKKSWLGGARYWSVLRSKTKLKRIREATKSLEVCR